MKSCFVDEHHEGSVACLKAHSKRENIKDIECDLPILYFKIYL